ncbi:MAG: dTMP kinase [Microbacteriaceae bacterium]
MGALFITLEGPDGSGKSTQSALLAEWLEAQGQEVVLTREPGGTALGLEIRQLLLHRPEDMAPRAEALLYAADRAHHVKTVVRPALAAGKIVLQDRYLDSSIAYQGAGRVLAAEEIRNISLWATENLLPELTILLDLSPEQSRERLDTARTQYDRLESEAFEFHQRVREHYLQLAAAEPERFFVLDGSEAVEVLQEKIRARVSALLG